LANGNTSGATTQAVATFDGTQLAPGQYNVVASYPGDANYQGSASVPVALTLAADFSVDNRGIPSQTVAAGQTASYINDLAVTPFFGYLSTVTVSCSVPVKGTACSVDPTSYSLASGAGIGTISVTTTLRTMAMLRDTNRVPLRPFLWQYGVGLLFCGVTVCSSRRRPRCTLRWWAVSSLLVFTIVIASLGCGGSSGGSSGGGGGGGGTNPNGTPAGTYTVTVTATDGTVTHTTPFTLIVR